MSPITLKLRDFPATEDDPRGWWSPIYIEPIIGSGERLVVGVAVSNGEESTVVEATSLQRLGALYGSGADPVRFAARECMRALAEDLQARGTAALDEPRLPFSTVTLGEKRRGAASSLDEMAKNWLKMVSSLEDPDVRARSSSKRSSAQRLSSTRLQTLRNVVEYIEQEKPTLRDFFSPRVLGGVRGAPKFDTKADFHGSRIVASIGVVDARHGRSSAEDLKARLFDLERERDKFHGTLLASRKPQFALLVLSRQDNDPRRLARDRIANEILDGAADTAKSLGIVVGAHNTPNTIGARLVELEIAA